MKIQEINAFLRNLVSPGLRYYRFGNIPGGDLRISITNQCNMSCVYCHNEGQKKDKNIFMTTSDFNSVLSLGVRFGAYKIRITGGEPLINKDLCSMLYSAKNTPGVRTVGINTNGILLNRELIDYFSSVGLDNLVFGVDCVDSEISKKSKVGVSSNSILNKILDAKRAGINVQIACTFDGDNEAAIIGLVRWCFKNSVLLKILELSNEETAENTSMSYMRLVTNIVSEFNLSLGKTIPFNEYFGIHDNGVRVLFFHSHCRIRECKACANMHMRITSDGNAKPCILRTDTQQNILTGDVELAMCKALHNLGNPPENPPV